MPERLSVIALGSVEELNAVAKLFAVADAAAFDWILVNALTGARLLLDAMQGAVMSELRPSRPLSSGIPLTLRALHLRDVPADGVSDARVLHLRLFSWRSYHDELFKAAPPFPNHDVEQGPHASIEALMRDVRTSKFRGRFWL